MASLKRYSEADRRSRNTNQDVTNIGVAGRRTGLRVEGARRGSDGFENESAFFSPTTTAKKAPRTENLISSARRSPAQSATRGGSGSFHSMELEESSAQDVASALKRRASELIRSPQKMTSRRIDSPTRTTLNSPALRARNSSAKPSPSRSVLRSPGRGAATTTITSKVARKLDFSRTDPGGTEETEVDVLAVTSKTRARPRTSNVQSRSRNEQAQAQEEEEDDEMAESNITRGILPDNEDDDPLPDVVLDAARDDDNTEFDIPNVPDEPDPQYDEFLNDDDADQEYASAREDEIPQDQATDVPPSTRATKQTNGARGNNRRKSNIVAASDDEPEAQTEEPAEAAQETGAEEETEVATTKQARKRGRSQTNARTKKDTTRTTSQSRERRERSTRTASPQRVWVEPILPHASDDNDRAADGTRKSSRLKIPPLAFWRGEKMLFGRGARRKSIGGTLGLALPQVTGIIHVDDNQSMTRTVPKRTSRRKNHHSSSRIKAESSSESSSEDDDGWEDNTIVEAPVRSYRAPNELVKKTLALPASAYQLREVIGQGIFFQKTLSEEPHFAAGVLDIPVGAGKPSKPSKQNTMFFFIFTGYVEIKVAENVFRLRKGGQFTIPRGNTYEIRNIGQKDARLFFSQSTDTLANHKVEHPEIYAGLEEEA